MNEKNGGGCTDLKLSINTSTMEPILTDDPQRRTLFPIKYPDLWQSYLTASELFWSANEIDLSTDVNDWSKRLTPLERQFISHILSFFVPSDMIVMDNLVSMFSQEVKIPEARHFYAFQLAIEAVHSHTYSMILDTLITDQLEKERLFDGVNRSPSIAQKTAWANKWINSNKSFGERLLAFAIVEGLFFSSSFCAIYWLKKRGLMPGLTFSNELIARDEGMHYEFALLLYTHLQERVSEARIREMLREAVAIEKGFICEALPNNLLGMNASMMEEYMEYVADRMLVALNMEKMYPSSRNPFDWMVSIGMNSKTNFFEKLDANYSKAPSKSTKLELIDDI